MKPRLESFGELIADTLLLVIKPVDIFSEWLARQITTAEKVMKGRRDFVIVLLTILALILVSIIIPLLDAIMRAG